MQREGGGEQEEATRVRLRFAQVSTLQKGRDATRCVPTLLFLHIGS